MKTKVLKNESQLKCSALVGRIIIYGPNRILSDQTEKHILIWLQKNGWADLVVVETRHQSTNSKIEFVPCEWQSNPLQTFSLKIPPDVLITILSRWLFEVI